MRDNIIKLKTRSAKSKIIYFQKVIDKLKKKIELAEMEVIICKQEIKKAKLEIK